MLRRGFSESVTEFLNTPLPSRQIHNSGSEFIQANTPESIPISIPGKNSGSRCFVSSITSALASYARTRVHDIESKPLAIGTLIVSDIASYLLKVINADHSTVLYNLPFSTVLFPTHTRIEFSTSVQNASKRYPGPIALRGLNAFQHQEFLFELKTLGFILIPYRRIFLVKNPEMSISARRLVRRELRLLERFPQLSLQLESEFPSHDVPIAIAMYRELYIERYSSENADYSEGFLRTAFATGLLAPITLRDENKRLIGFVALYENESSVTAPLIGHDKTRCDVPTYRILMIELLRYAGDKGKLLNWSSGVAEFKQLRGASSILEYIAVRPEALFSKIIYRILAIILAIMLSRRMIHALLRT